MSHTLRWRKSEAGSHDKTRDVSGMTITLSMPNPTLGQAVVGVLVMIAGVVCACISVATWRRPDALYDRPAVGFFGEDWRGARRSFLPAATTFAWGGLVVVVARWWRSAPSAVEVGLVLFLWLGIGLTGSVFIVNRPRRLVRPSLRDEPGWLRDRRRQKSQRSTPP
jgi:hypothetical protein